MSRSSISHLSRAMHCRCLLPRSVSSPMVKLGSRGSTILHLWHLAELGFAAGPRTAPRMRQDRFRFSRPFVCRALVVERRDPCAGCPSYGVECAAMDTFDPVLLSEICTSAAPAIMKISLIHLLAYSTCTFISTTSAYGAGHHVARSLTDSHGQHKLRMAADLHRRAPVPAQSAPQDPSDGLNDSWYDTEADDEDIEDDEDDLGYLYDDEEDGEPDSSGGQSLVKRKASKGKSKKRKSGLIGYVDKVRTLHTRRGWLLTILLQTCGPSGARSKVSKTSGPNGKQSWLNHGISKSHPDSKWVRTSGPILAEKSAGLQVSHSQSPPAIKLSQLKAVSLSKALSKSDSPFHACKPYLPIFNRVAKQHGLPPIVLASLAMQESEFESQDLPETERFADLHYVDRLL